MQHTRKWSHVREASPLTFFQDTWWCTSPWKCAEFKEKNMSQFCVSKSAWNKQKFLAGACANFPYLTLIFFTSILRNDLISRYSLWFSLKTKGFLSKAFIYYVGSMWLQKSFIPVSPFPRFPPLFDYNWRHSGLGQNDSLDNNQKWRKYALKALWRGVM